jgi:hypothetical protein
MNSGMIVNLWLIVIYQHHSLAHIVILNVLLSALLRLLQELAMKVDKRFCNAPVLDGMTS